MICCDPVAVEGIVTRVDSFPVAPVFTVATTVPLTQTRTCSNAPNPAAETFTTAAGEPDEGLRVSVVAGWSVIRPIHAPGNPL